MCAVCTNEQWYYKVKKKAAFAEANMVLREKIWILDPDTIYGL